MKFFFNLIPILLLLIEQSFSRGVPRVLPAYSYNSNGDDWGDLCRDGIEQSPIDIYPIAEGCNTDMQVSVGFKPGAQIITLTNKGDTLQADGVFSALIARNVDNVLASYESLQFHIHAPSEHLIAGKSYDLELHIVHNISDESVHKLSTELGGRSFAVLGLLFEVDDSVGPNPFIEALRFEELEQPRSVDLGSLLGSQISSPINYFTYKGSLTTPGCNEVVNWFVVEQPLKIRSEQLAKFNNYYTNNGTFAAGRGNNRNVQPLDGRLVRRGGVACVEQLNYLYVYLGLYAAFNLSIIVMIKLTGKNRQKVQDISTHAYLSEQKKNNVENAHDLSENVALPMKDMSVNMTIPPKDGSENVNLPL